MKNLIELFFRNKNFIVYLIFASLSLWLVFSNNFHHQNRFLATSNSVIGSFHEKTSFITNYVGLEEENENLRIQLALTKMELDRNYLRVNQDTGYKDLSDFALQYTYTSASLVNKTTGFNQNFITLDKGFSSGVEPNDGVIDFSGSAVGRVVKVSEHFSVVAPLINTSFNLRVKLRKNEVDGVLKWRGGDTEVAEIFEIGKRVPISIGDSIVTSGASAFFPEGHSVGLVLDVEPIGDVQNLKIKLSTNFRGLKDVLIISNKFRKEQEKLEAELDIDNESS